MSKVRSVIFDLYSTLIDIATSERREGVFQTLSTYLQYYGSRLDAEGLSSAFEREKDRYLQSSGERYPDVDLEVVFHNILREQDVASPFLAESCCKLLRALSREHFQLFPDTLPVLEEMKAAGYPLAIVSDAQKVFTPEEIKVMGLKRFFDCVILSTHYGFRKPDPRIFAMACALLNVPPEEAVYIGNDPESDVKGARKIDMRAVLLDRRSKNKDSGPEADFYAVDLWEAWDWIKRTA